MRFERSVTALNATDPQAAALFYAQHLGMQVDLDIGWFVNLSHPDHPGFELALTRFDHESIPETHRTPTAGTAIALVVDNVDEVAASMTSAGHPPIVGPVDHPWGQRQILIAAPDGVLLDVIQQTTPDHDWLVENGLVDPEP